MKERSVSWYLSLAYVLFGLRVAFWYFNLLVGEVMGIDQFGPPTLSVVIPPVLDFFLYLVITALTFISLKKLKATQYKKKIYKAIIVLLTVFLLLIGLLGTIGSAFNVANSIEAYINRDSWEDPYANLPEVIDYSKYE